MRDAMKYSKFMNLRKTKFLRNYELNNFAPWRFCVIYFFTLFFLFSCFSQEVTKKEIKVGAERISEYFPIIKNKKIAIVANQTSMVGNVHLVDSLLSLGIKIKKVFAPEHGFRGVADAGEQVKNSKDKKTGLPIISLYGNNKKPKPNDLKDVDIVIFDIQDVGVRFYTYISTMHYMMEACAENKKLLIILDRPNPNGFYIDGPILEEKYKSFVGMHPIPLVHGLTIGELAQMINSEKWLKNGIQCTLNIITCKNYSHKYFYELPLKPSPNLPNMMTVYLYPSLGLFEGTIVSVGRGTEKPFQIIGHPDLQNTSYKFTPKSMKGAKNPPYENIDCSGFDLSEIGEKEMRSYKRIYLQWLIGTYNNSKKTNFFLENNFFNLLAGNAELMQQIKEGRTEKEIRQSWENDLEKYKTVRKKYLLYEDFE